MNAKVTSNVGFVLIKMFVMAYDQTLNLNQIITILGLFKNCWVSFVVDFMYTNMKHLQ